MQLFKKVSVIMIAVILLMTGTLMPTLTYAEDNTSTTANDSSSSSASTTTVQSDTYGTNGSTTAPDNTSGAATPDPATSAAPAATTQSTPAAKKSILTDAFLTDANGNVIQGDGSGAAIDPDAPINLNYKWSLPEDGSYKAGSTFEFDLPSTFTLYNDINNVSLDFGGQSVGSFNATQSGHVTVTFNSTIERYSDIHGTMQFRTALSKQTVSGSTEVKIPVPLGDSSQVIIIYIKPAKGNTISKKGAVITGGKIRWTVDLNTNGEKLDNAVLSDPMLAGLKLDPASIQVYTLNVKGDGSTSQGSQLSSGYTLTADDSQFSLSFDSSTRSAYRVIYVTSITDNTQTVFKNKATLSTSSGSATAEAQVTVQQQFLSKKVDSYDSATGTINWSIGYNLNNQSIPQSQAILKDRFNSSQKLVAGSVKVYDTNNNVLTEGTDYTVTTVAPQNGTTGFDLQFNKDVQTAYTIKYSTAPVGQIIQNDTINNTVTAGNTSASASQPIKGLSFVKTLMDANYIRKDATWKLALDNQGQPLQNALIDDQFPNGGLEFLPDTLKVMRSDGSDYPASLYTVTVNDARAGFRITFLQPPSEPLNITYRTTFDADWKKNKSEVSYQNIAALYWQENGTYRTIPSEARFWPDNLTVNNGSKDGTYNAVTKEITWTIKANYNNKKLTNAVLTDTIEAGQSYVPGSLTVSNMTLLGWWNGVEQGAPVNPADYTVTTPADGANGGTLQIKFAKPINSAYWITFKTTLTGQVIPKSVHNAATLKGNEGDYPWAANVSIPNGGEYVNKTGEQKGNNINWTININRGQSYVENAKIIDTPTSNQILLTDSFHLYNATVGTDGSLKRGTEAVQGTDYKLSVIPGTPEQFELSFTKPIQSAYILDYATLITAGDRDKVSNSVKFTGNGITTGTVQTNKEIIVRSSSASGTGSGATGNLILHKVDSADATISLAGAVFQLQDTLGLRSPITLTTDAQGRILFTQLLYGTYNLQEITAPAGYVLDPTVHSVTINAANQQAGNVLSITLTNTKAPPVVGSLLVNKVDSADASIALAGAVFQLQDAAGVNAPIVVTTDAQGQALFNQLPYGTYNLQEITAPQGYVLDSTVHSITIDATNQQAGTGLVMTLTNTKTPVTPTPTPTPGTTTPGTPTPTPSKPDKDRPSTPTTPGNSNPTPGTTTPTDPTVPISDDPVPQGTVTPDQPSVPPTDETTPDIPIPDDPVPQGTTPPESTPDIPVPDEPVPRGTTVPSEPSTPVKQPSVPMLPKTGEDSNAPFWIAGASLVALGILLNRMNNRRTRSSGKSE